MAEREGRVLARATRSRVIRLSLAVAVAAALIVFVVVPQWKDAAHAVSVVSHVSVPLLLAGLAVEVLSWAALARLTSTTLDPATKPGFWRVARVDIAG
ncbi:MAG: hypothetical protein ACTHON_03350, partial [Humibacter sp.]